MIELKCRCGERFRADPQHVGRRLRCRCGRTLTVRAPRPAPAAALRSRVGGALDRLELRLQALRSRASGPPAPARAGVPPRRGPREWLAPLLRADVPVWMPWAVCGYLALVLAATAVVWGWGDRTWIGTVVLFGPRWLLLVPLGILVPVAMLVLPRALVPLALAAVLALGPVMGLRLGWQGLLAGGSAEATLRVVSFNAEGRPETILTLLPLLDRWQAEVVAVQECSQHVPALMEGRYGWHFHQDGAQCLLSRYPIESAEPVRWEALDAARASGLGGSGAVVRYRVRTPDREVRLVNLHLETPRKGLEQLRYGGQVSPVAGNTLLREIGSRRASEAVAPERASVVVMGDFNMPVESTIFRASWGDLQNAFSRAGWGFGMTKDNGWIRVRIDHVLVGSDWRVRRAFVGPDVGSDHWPVFAELRWVGRD